MRHARAAVFALLVGACGCDLQPSGKEDAASTSSATVQSGGLTATQKPSPNDQSAPSVRQASSPSNSPGSREPASANPDTEEPLAPMCPQGMVYIPDGVFWVGTEREVYDHEENPRFSTHVAGFCADRLEVSTAQYEACVQAGKCPALAGTNRTCNTSAKGKANHPINCVDYAQATAICEVRGARLPTEIEWEYMARGGAEMRKYPWGDAHPDGKTCWKHAGTCERGIHAEGAFGLHDVVGNVWEWTSSWFGHYPWPSAEGRHRVYRGGSWSRRFEKWLRPSLRNRLDPSKFGSHLGVRCVQTPPGTQCPYGAEADGACRFGVEQVLCLDGRVFNGARCAEKGDERKCLPGATETPGFGCVRPRVSGSIDQSLDTAGVTWSRSPGFDADCQKNTPAKPHAYRFVGGSHLARNVVGKGRGCKNRDVGVGFNSACCP